MTLSRFFKTAWAYAGNREPPPVAPDREILSFQPEAPGTQICTLECGHRVQINHHRLRSLLCTACLEEGKK